jgi:LysM repeat protein
LSKPEIMRKRILPVILFILVLSMLSCKISKPVISSAVSKSSEEDYIDRYKDIAIKEMKRTGVPASITIAQGIIESDCGRSVLAREANNHFGVKCHNDWNGPTMRYDDDRKNECFRKYSKVEDSYRDHSDFLKSGSRYSFLFQIETNDYKSWAKGLKKAGYATNPDYANMLIRKIEQYSLWNLDKGINIAYKQEKAVTATTDSISVRPALSLSEKMPAGNANIFVVTREQRIKENNRIQYIVVKDGDTKERVENEFQLLKWELAKYNELKNDFVLTPGQILYLQPKRDKAEPGKEYYYAVSGDTMYTISQQFGIRLKKLYEMNRMAENSQPSPGEKIWLRNIKPVD